MGPGEIRSRTCAAILKIGLDPPLPRQMTAAADLPKEERSPRPLLENTIVALAYLAGGVLSIIGGLITTGPDGQSSMVWLPPGIALAAMLARGNRTWPGIWAGAVVLDAVIGHFEAPTMKLPAAIVLDLVISTASVVQALVTCRLIQRFAGRKPTLDHARAVLGFLLCSIPVSVIEGTAGSLAMIALGIRKLSTLPLDLGSWWISDTVSVFLVTPVMLAWVGTPAHIWRPRRAQLSIPLSIALVLMAAAFVQANHLEADGARRQFELRTSHLKDQLAERLAQLSEDISWLRDLEDVAVVADGHKFAEVAARVRGLDPSVGALGWVPVVPASRREAFERQMREHGDPSYVIRDITGARAAWPRDVLLPVQYVEPIEMGAQIAGVDLGSEDRRRAVFAKAARAGTAVMSAPLALRVPDGPRAGVLAAVPLYYDSGASPPASPPAKLASVRGFVVGILRVAPMMKLILSPATARELDITIEDPDAPAEERLVFASASPHLPGARVPYTSISDIRANGRTWRLTVKPTPTYIEVTRSWLSPAVSLAGLAFATLLCGFLLVTTGNAANIRQQVEERTAELRDEIAIHERMERALKESEHELASHRERLEELVHARTAELEVAKATAEKANRAKSAFLANMSHELRTPMHAVLAYARLALEHDLDAKLEGHIERIVRSGERLLALLNDLLDLSKLEAGKMRVQREPHDVNQIVQEVAQEIEPLLAKKKVSLSIAPPPAGGTIAHVDREQMSQVFRNVLANAVRFSSEGARLSVSFASAQLPPLSEGAAPRRALQIAFADQGVGIPPDELEIIFDKFVQSSKTRTNAGGTGLGLAICKQITELHGGRIQAENNVGGGATFVVTVPRQAEPSASKETEVAA